MTEFVAYRIVGILSIVSMGDLWTILMHLYLVGFGALCTALSLLAILFYAETLTISHLRTGYRQYHLSVKLRLPRLKNKNKTKRNNNNEKKNHSRLHLCSLAIFHWLNIATGDCATLSIIFFYWCNFFFLLFFLIFLLFCFVTITIDTKICTNWSVGNTFMANA